MHVNKRLVFIHAKPFADGGNGLALRTRLAFGALTGACAATEKHLISASGEAEAALAERMGWNYHRIETFDKTHRPGARAILRLAAFVGSPVSQYMRSLLLTMLGGADVSVSVVAPLLQSIGKADIWLARSDLLHLVSSAVPGSKVVIDANDTVANLIRRYDPRSHVRKAAFRRLDTVARDVEREELRLAGLCSTIIAISPEDREYYSRSSCRSVVMEESCLTTPVISNKGAAKWDVGFIGGHHRGAVLSACNLLRLASKPELGNLSFGIAGSVCDRLKNFKRTSNVQLVGRVSSAPDFLASCRQVVLWSESETGTSVKFQEAILCGTTVLANHEAARWSKAKDGRDYIQCNSELEFEQCLLARIRLAKSSLREECERSKVHARFASILLK